MNTTANQTTARRSVYDAFTSDERIAILLKADNLGCETAHWYSGAGWCFKVPKSKGDNIFEARDKLRALMAENGLIETDSHLSARSYSDDPETAWYGPYNLPPAQPAYLLFVTFEVKP